MESAKNEQSPSILNTIALHNSQFSCSESQKQKFISLFNHTPSFDSEYYQYNSLEIPNFSDGKSNDNQSNSDNESKKLSSIPENVSEEESSSIMEKKETGPKIYLMNKNGHLENNSTNKKIEFNNKINNINESNELEIDNNIIMATNNRCICTSSLCQIY